MTPSRLANLILKISRMLKPMKKEVAISLVLLSKLEVLFLMSSKALTKKLENEITHINNFINNKIIIIKFS